MRFLGIAIASLLLVLPAQAQQMQDWHVCQEKDKTTLGNHVRSCTAIIRSDRSSSKDKAVAYNNRGNFLRDRGELDRAIADFDAAVRLEPKSADTYINRGIARYRRGDLDRAMAVSIRLHHGRNLNVRSHHFPHRAEVLRDLPAGDFHPRA